MKLFLRILTCAIFCISFSISYAQKERAKELVKILASPEFHGRGYVNNGDQIAADFIQTKFKEFGVQAFNQNYEQEFSLGVNTFPGNMSVIVDGDSLETGIDFMIDPSSGSASGKYELFWISRDDVMDQNKFRTKIQEANKTKYFNKKFIYVIDAEGLENKELQEMKGLLPFFVNNNSENLKTHLIFRTEEKFTWSVGRSEHPKALIHVNADVLPKNTQYVQLEIENKFIPNYSTQNVIGFVPSKDSSSKKFVVFSAHYDHLGRMGADAYIPGANDNASGVSMLLLLAEHYANNKADVNIVFIAFGAEEAGLVGSKYFVDHPLIKLKKIRCLLNLDLLGTGDEGIAVVNATVYKKEFELLNKIIEEENLFSRVKKRGPAANSDHHWFHEKGVPCFFLYTMGGIKAYHDVLDKAETLPLTKFNEAFRLFTLFTDQVR